LANCWKILDRFILAPGRAPNGNVGRGDRSRPFVLKFCNKTKNRIRNLAVTCPVTNSKIGWKWFLVWQSSQFFRRLSRTINDGTLATLRGRRKPCARESASAGIRQRARQECQRVSTKTPHPQEREARDRVRHSSLPLDFDKICRHPLTLLPSVAPSHIAQSCRWLRWTIATQILELQAKALTV